MDTQELALPGDLEDVGNEYFGKKTKTKKNKDHLVYVPCQWETHYIITSSLIGWAHTQNDPLKIMTML